MGEVISILSGKGGTGKTALCAGIATILASSERKVLCIDGDVGLRNLDIFLGLDQMDALSFLDVCSGNYPLSAAVAHPQYPTMRFLTAPVNCAADAIDPAQFEAMLRLAREEFEFIFIDAPSGVGDGMKLCGTFADRCIVTTLPDPASIRCADRCGQELEKLGQKNVRLVINRMFPELLKALKMNVDDIMDAAGLPLLGIVPSDPNISFSLAKGVIFTKYTRLGAAAAYKRIAKRIQGLPVPIANR
ncbi:MAG: P-loop NTPase [Oscillospiraceae bacterium]|nr:P-loop NTPase [Oscillospiraceae bacterium]